MLKIKINHKTVIIDKNNQKVIQVNVIYIYIKYLENIINLSFETIQLQVLRTECKSELQCL